MLELKVVNHHTQSAVRFLKLQAQILDTLLSVKGHVKCLRPTGAPWYSWHLSSDSEYFQVHALVIKNIGQSMR